MGWIGGNGGDTGSTEPTAPPVEDVDSLGDGVGTDCTPDGAIRTTREAQAPPHSAWTILERWYEQGTSSTHIADPPSDLSQAFIKRKRTLYFKCQKQVCNNGTWILDFPETVTDCNQTQTETFELSTGGQTLTIWTTQLRDAAIDSETGSSVNSETTPD